MKSLLEKLMLRLGFVPREDLEVQLEKVMRYKFVLNELQKIDSFIIVAGDATIIQNSTIPAGSKIVVAPEAKHCLIRNIYCIEGKK